MCTDARRIAQNILETLYTEADLQREPWNWPDDPDAETAIRKDAAFIVWSDLQRILGHLAEINHIPWPPKKPRALQLVVNNKKTGVAAPVLPAPQRANSIKRRKV